MYQKGDVVSVKFPFSDLTGAKFRPALIIWAPGAIKEQDYLLMQITSELKWLTDGISFPINPTDLQVNFLPKPSLIRPHKIFTANDSLIRSRIGAVTDPFLQHVIASFKALLNN